VRFVFGMAIKQLFGLSRARQAFLLPAYAELYPDLPAGVWLSASEVALLVRLGVEREQRPWPSDGPRVLADEHFLFRDGQSALARALRAWRVARRVRRTALH
jgi:hypothetical protein